MIELTTDGTFRAGEAGYWLLVGDEKVRVGTGGWQRVEGWLPAFESTDEVGGIAYRCRLFADRTALGPVAAAAVEARDAHLARRQATVWLEPASAPVRAHPGEAMWRPRAGPEGAALAWQATLERGQQACLMLALPGSAGDVSGPPEWQHALELWRDAVEAEGVIHTPDDQLNQLWKRSLVRLLLADSQARAEAEKQAREAAQSSEAEAAPAPGAPTEDEMDLAEAAGTAARIKAMLVREQGEELHLFAGIPGEWLALGKMTYVAQLPTRWGKISCFLKAKQGWGQVVIYPPLEGRPQALVLHAPVGLKIAKAVADGRPQPVEGGEAVRLPPDAHLVQLTWASEAGQDGQEAPQASGKQG